MIEDISLLYSGFFRIFGSVRLLMRGSSFLISIMLNSDNSPGMFFSRNLSKILIQNSDFSSLFLCVGSLSFWISR